MKRKLQGLALVFGVLSASCALAQGGCVRVNWTKPIVPDAVLSATHSAYNSAYPIVFGRKASASEHEASYQPIMLGNVVIDKTCTTKWEGVSWEAPKFTDAVAVIRTKLLTPSNGLERAAVIDLAYFEALGRVSTQEEQLSWDVKMRKEKLTFANIKLAHLAAISQNNAERKAMIERSYQSSFGRPASPGDLDYWGPRKDQYSQIRKASLAYLYGDGMAAELPGTIRRALTEKLGREPNEQEGKMLLAKAMMSKDALYDDLVAMP